MPSLGSPALEALSKAIVHYEEGDVMRLANWVQLLEQVRREVPQDRALVVDALVLLVKGAMRDGSPAGFIETLGRGLDELAQGGAADAGDLLWQEHGPAFVTEAKSRLARAQELALELEAGATADGIGELFRIVHTIKGEAGFLHRVELANRAHLLEGALDAVRSGAQAPEGPFIDEVLAGLDGLRALLDPGTASPANPAAPAEPTKTREAVEVLRIPADKIDALVSLVGELLVALESEAGEPSPLVKKLSRGLQQSALRLRTEPVKDLLGRVKRGVRDLSHSLGKPVDVVVLGGELELDRNLIANLEEPLMHLVRNALDHGLEAPDQRRSAGKPDVAQLKLVAQRRGNRVLISVTDDGRGLDTDKIWRKGLEKGLVAGDRPTDDEVHSLIFRPGFSTADQLTQVSGRGVGMDIVSQVVQANRGRIELTSRRGAGTEVTLNFPLSTAVLEGLVVSVGGRSFLVPVASAVEALRLAPDALRTIAPGSQVVSLRGTPLPVVSLRRALDGRPDPSVPGWGVVVETPASGRHILLVDQVESKKEVVIRSLGGRFQGLRGVTAVTILAGGRLALVLDVDQVIELGGLAS